LAGPLVLRASASQAVSKRRADPFRDPENKTKTVRLFKLSKDRHDGTLHTL